MVDFTEILLNIFYKKNSFGITILDFSSNAEYVIPRNQLVMPKTALKLIGPFIKMPKTVLFLLVSKTNSQGLFTLTSVNKKINTKIVLQFVI